MAINQTRPVKRFSTLARGQSLSRINHRRSRHYQRVYSMYTKRALPLTWWLGRGRPLDPYLEGLVLALLRKEFYPKDLKVVPDEFLVQPGMADFLEWSCLRSWMKSWLSYVKWYYAEACSPDATIQAFFDAPVVTTSWKVTSEEPHLVRWGLLWRISYFLGQWLLKYQFWASHTSGYLLGGVSGNDFLVMSLGLYQPKAWRGVLALGVVYDSSLKPNPSYVTVR